MYNNKKVAVIIAAAGSGTRMGSGIPKQFIKLSGKRIINRSVEVFEENASIDDIYIVCNQDYVTYCKEELIYKSGFQKVKEIISGGAQRQDSVYHALKAMPSDIEYVLIHDGARPFVTQEIIDSLIKSTYDHNAAVAAVPVKDTIKAAQIDVFTETLDRNVLYLVQTPQGFQKQLLQKAYEYAYSQNFYGTDDAVLVERLGRKVYLVKGDYNNIKITTKEDLAVGEVILKAQSIQSEQMELEDKTVTNIEIRVGTGYDVHQLVEGRKLILGGVEIPFEKGLLGHSDADVLTHAIMDALLGACALGDIGRHFPDHDDSYKDISSLVLLKRVGDILINNGYIIGNIDATIVAQRPKIAPYIEEMIKNIGKTLEIEKSKINLKGTTTERLGFCGREEGIAAQASVLIKKEI